MKFEKKLLSIIEEIQLEQNLIWIFGINIPSWFLPNLFNSYSIIRNFNLSSHLEQNTWKENKLVSLSDFTKYREGEGKYDYFFNNGFYNTWSYYLRKLILNRIFAQLNDLSSKIIIDETKMNSKLIIQILKNSKSIIILRDRKEIIKEQANQFIKSQSTTWMGGKRIMFNDKFSVLEFCTQNYIFFEKNLLTTAKTLSEENCLFIKWENMQDETNSVLKKIYDFSNLNINENGMNEIKNNIKDKLDNSTQTAKTLDLTDKENNLIDQIIEKHLSKDNHTN